MNTKQRLILLLGVTVFCWLGLRPPWLEENRGLATSWTERHREWIFDPPQGDGPGIVKSAQIDFVEVLIEWGMVLAATGSLMALVSEKRER